ncbi:hypothetical protein P7K49_030318 [Saguinus oedipus]|uniref:Uncharacterized protein n=1 Tax=Saguinus oedipus TaxID=9490 RepID=A0ABQ9U1W3_SAGOE|nr:hypothetical protein P7K49_030318 [Saguinus oedipus]
MAHLVKTGTHDNRSWPGAPPLPSHTQRGRSPVPTPGLTEQGLKELKPDQEVEAQVGASTAPAEAALGRHEQSQHASWRPLAAAHALVLVLAGTR